VAIRNQKVTLKDFAPILDDKQLFPGLSLTIDPGEIVCVMGTSGIGKTSLLRAINSSLAHTGLLHNPHEIWHVYQENDQLFPWFDIMTNMDMACTPEWHRWALRWNLKDQLHKKPGQLSVGQRQRFTLLRAAFSGRGLLLCDEPLSGVDGLTNKQVWQDFRELVSRLKLSVLWVTHNPAEADALGVKKVLLSVDKVTIDED
jgi:ABC-type nitrate/sulfonate/bicarbonate transport system ATPase subunit